jgi:hypothetical protein
MAGRNGPLRLLRGVDRATVGSAHRQACASRAKLPGSWSRSCPRAAGLLLLGCSFAAPLHAQDGNILLPVAQIELLLRSGDFDLLDLGWPRAALIADRTSRVLLGFPGDVQMLAKWKTVGAGAHGFNNEPRYDLASYQFQKLFLDEPDFVVPPTVLRSLSLVEYALIDPDTRPTLRGTSSVLILLQYWLSQVTNRDVYSPERLLADTAYARHFGNLNVLTYLINHKDANTGNLLISTDPLNPRVFAVDNDIAFLSPSGDRGTDWGRLLVRRVPQTTIDRLRSLTREDLQRDLGVVAEFALRDGLLVAAQKTENLRPASGVRRSADRVQFGLTSHEIRDLHRRIRRLVQLVDAGRVETF